MKNETDQILWDRRDRLKIMAEILEFTKESQLKTRIMYKVNLSYNQINEYLSFLTKMGFIKIQIEDKKKSYEITKKGNSFIQNYMEMENLLKPEQLQIPIIMK